LVLYFQLIYRIQTSRLSDNFWPQFFARYSSHSCESFIGYDYKTARLLINIGAFNYNHQINSEFVIISNGVHCICCRDWKIM